MHTRNLMTDFFLKTADRALDLLDYPQFEAATSHVIFELPRIVANNPLGEFIEFGDWFDDLDAAQQLQVIDFYNAHLLDDYGLVLTKCVDNDGRSIGYRFEIDFHHPASSR